MDKNNVSQELPPSLIWIVDSHAVKNVTASIDLGPSEVQTLSGLQCNPPDECEIDTVLGVLPSKARDLPQKKMNK